MPSIPSPELAICCFDDLDFFTDFENEFPTIVYNDAQTSKSDFIVKIWLFHHVSRDIGFLDMRVWSTPDTDIVDFEGRLARIHMREVHRVPVFDFGGLPDLMAEGLTARMTMEHRDEAGVSVFTSRAWRRMFDIRGPLVHELILEFFSTFRFGQAILDLDTPGTLQGGDADGWVWCLLRTWLCARQIPDKGDLRDYWMGISSAGDFLGTTPSYTAIRDPILRADIDVWLVNVPYLYWRGIFEGCLRWVSLPTEDAGLIFLVGQFLLLVFELIDTWAWVAMGPERQPDVAAGAPADVEDAPIIDKGGQADPAPVQAPQQPPPPPPAPAFDYTLRDDQGKISTEIFSRELLLLYSRGGPGQRTSEGPAPPPAQHDHTAATNP
ncbi:hypothetical protein Tco_0593025 [Tanacetum coccineum]